MTETIRRGKHGASPLRRRQTDKCKLIISSYDVCDYAKPANDVTPGGWAIMEESLRTADWMMSAYLA